jgi:hypothetical protein
MNYAEVLKRAGQIVWKFKVLWIFGILASCGQGGGGSSGGGSSSGSSSQYYGGNIFPPAMQYRINEVGRFVADNMWIFGVLILLCCILIIVVIFFSTIGRIALIKGTVKAEAGAEHMGLGELFSESLPYFWRVFLFSLLSGLTLFVVFMLLFLPAIALSVITFGLALICCLPFLCLLIPVGMAIAVILEQAIIAIVVDNTGILEGLGRGWEVVKRNLAPIIIMALILFVGSLMVGLVLAAPMFAIFLAAILPFIFSGDQGIPTMLYVALTCLCIYIPFLIVAKGVIMAYVQTAWTLTYMRLTGGKQPQEIISAPAGAPAVPIDSLDA